LNVPEPPTSFRIGVVDDEPSIRLAIRMILEDAGYVVLEAADLAAARTLLRAEPLDVLIIDKNLPDGTGLELGKIIRDESLDIETILVTGHASVDSAIEAVHLGLADYLRKPFHMDELLNRVKRSLRTLALRRDHSALLAELEERVRDRTAELEQSYSALEKLENMRDSLVHMLVHDMRSPLTVVVTYLQLLRMDLDGVAGTQHLSDIDTAHGSAQRLVRMINQILDVSRIEAGEMPLKIAAHDTTTLIEGGLAILGVTSESDEVTWERAQTAQETVQCDKHLVERVVANLVGNARKYADGVARIDVEREGEHVVLSISDTGDGIPPEQQGRIFERFAQVAEKPQVASSGLGLAFCRLAVEAQGGAIGVRSQVGVGSTFYFSLPLSKT